MKPIQMLTALLLSLLFVACEFEHEQNGYPKKVHFGPEAETLSFKGDGKLLGFTLEEGNTTLGDEIIGDSIFVSMDWITVKAALRGSEMIITVKPLTEGKSRKIKIYGDFGRSFSETTVTQKR